jgi:CheY-like chemotaxis protein
MLDSRLLQAMQHPWSFFSLRGLLRYSYIPTHKRGWPLTPTDRPQGDRGRRCTRVAFVPIVIVFSVVSSDVASRFPVELASRHGSGLQVHSSLLNIVLLFKTARYENKPIPEKTILIIDDDEHLLLKSNGYAVVWARDAVDAIAVARKEVPDPIILDLGLPAGDGFLVLERMRALADLVAIPVIVLSAWNPTDNKRRAVEAGATAYFHKPPDNHDLLMAIRQALGEAVVLSTFLKA